MCLIYQVFVPELNIATIGILTVPVYLTVDTWTDSPFEYFCLWSIPTFISNMGGTNDGRASLSVTRLCLWAVWPEQNVNLLRSSCLRQTCDKENRQQNIISVKSINILKGMSTNVRLGKNMSNLKSFPSSIFPSEDWISIWSLGTSSREKLLPARPGTGSSSSKLLQNSCHQNIKYSIFPWICTCDSHWPRHSLRFPSPAPRSWHETDDIPLFANQGEGIMLLTHLPLTVHNGWSSVSLNVEFLVSMVSRVSVSRLLSSLSQAITTLTLTRPRSSPVTGRMEPIPGQID